MYVFIYLSQHFFTCLFIYLYFLRLFIYLFVNLFSNICIYSEYSKTAITTATFKQLKKNPPLKVPPE